MKDLGILNLGLDGELRGCSPKGEGIEGQTIDSLHGLSLQIWFVFGRQAIRYFL